MSGRLRGLPRRSAQRRGTVTVALIIVLLLAELLILGAVVGVGREQRLTVDRLDTVRAFYAAEAGMNMAIRELRTGIDEDGDGGLGSVSDDGDDADDPSLGVATVRVTAEHTVNTTTLTSRGRSGGAVRVIRATLKH